MTGGGFEELLEGSTLNSPAAKELQAQGAEALRQWTRRRMVKQPLRVEFAQKAVIYKDGKILLVRKSPDDPYQPEKWELPGGRLQADESPNAGLAREVYEETGLAVSPGRPVALWDWWRGDASHGQMVIAVARLCEAYAGEVTLAHQDEGDHIDLAAWFTPDEVLNLDLIFSDRGPIAEVLSQLD